VSYRYRDNSPPKKTICRTTLVITTIRANRCRQPAISVPWMKQPAAPRTATLIAVVGNVIVRGTDPCFIQGTKLPNVSSDYWPANCVAEAPSPSSANACRTAGVKLGLVCFALVASKCLYEYWHEFGPKASSLCSAESYLWSPYVIGQTIIFSSCSFFLSSVFFFFFSSPNLSGRRLDV